MARVRSLYHAGRTVAPPRPELGAPARFDEHGVAEVTDDVADFLVYQFQGVVERLPDEEPEPAQKERRKLFGK